MSAPQSENAPHAYDGREFEAAANLRNYYSWITEILAPCLTGHGVEVGAGQGNFAHYLRPHFTRLDLIEPSEKHAAMIEETCRDDPAVDVFAMPVEAYAEKIGAEARDAICLINVLEHIEDDRAALALFHHLLRPGGSLCLFVPALPILFSKLDKIFGHHRRYLQGDLMAKTTEAGFEIVTCRYMDLPGVFAWGLVNTILGSTNLDARMMQIYDSYFIPPTRWFERIFPPPLGKSLILIAKKSIIVR